MNNPAETKKTGKKLSRAIKAALSALVLAVIFTKIDFNALLRSFSAANPRWILVAVCINFTESFLLAAIWWRTLNVKGRQIPLWPVIRVQFVSNFLGFVMPSTMGPDLMKVYGLARYMDDWGEAISSLVVVRLAGHVTLFLIAAFAMTVFTERLPHTPFMEYLGFVMMAVAAFLLCGLLFSSVIMRWTKRFLDAAHRADTYGKLVRLYSLFVSYLTDPAVMMTLLTGTFLMQLVRIAYIYVISLALGFSVDPAVFCIFVPIIIAALLLPVSLSGIGVREASYVFLFSQVGLSMEQALSLSLLNFALDIAIMAAGGLVYWKEGLPKGSPGSP